MEGNKINTTVRCMNTNTKDMLRNQMSMSNKIFFEKIGRPKYVLKFNKKKKIRPCDMYTFTAAFKPIPAFLPQGRLYRTLTSFNHHKDGNYM